MTSLLLFTACQKEHEQQVSQSESIEDIEQLVSLVGLEQSQIEESELMAKSANNPDCEEPYFCEATIELVELFPNNPNYQWLVVFQRSDLNYTDCDFNDPNRGNLCSNMVWMADPALANTLNNAGVGPFYTHSMTPGDSFNYPYFEKQKYWINAYLNPDGSGLPNTNAYIKFNMYHPDGTFECIVARSNYSTLLGPSCWNTAKCTTRHRFNLECD